MNETDKIMTAMTSPWDTHTSQAHDVERPKGWKYKSFKIGPITLPYYASPEAQLLLVSFVCFLCPGMFNALQGLGGTGLLAKDEYLNASTASLSALYATFAVVGFFAGTVVNVLGIRTSLAFGGLGYCVYVSAFLCFNHTQNLGYVVFSGMLLGCCAGILWSAQGAIMMSYPSERMKGRYISWFWIIFNMGAVIGSLVSLALNKSRTSGPITSPTYIIFLLLTFLGALLSLTLLNATSVLRTDNTRILLMKHPTWRTEFLGLWQTLVSDPYIILLFPMFFASNWFYTYQFNCVNLARFNPRTRALNNVLYWIAQMAGATVFGFALDAPNIRRTTRAKIAWVVMFALTCGVWGGGYVYQRGYVRQKLSKEEEEKLMDWNTTGYVGPMFLYAFYGFYDAAWQTCVYWFMGAISNNSRKLANFAGFYKGIQSAGAAIIWRLDGLKVPYMNLFISCWVLLAGSLVVALPVMLVKIKDTVPVEEDLKFTDETLEDVIGLKETYHSPELRQA
ncbi:major facilitator superfamily domain-containing protein [Paraphoma chrysanthemicola]|nr:major facilitator superfamily domain-containing protein [Paraphoma chrysanthemicola]